MSLALTRQYESEAAQICTDVADLLGPNDSGIIYGSVGRSFGPFGDVDLIVGQESPFPDKTYLGPHLEVAAYHFPDDELADYLQNTMRGWAIASDAIVVGNGKRADMYRQQLQDRVVSGMQQKGELVIALLAEEQADTNRPDVIHNHSRYALKRSAGGKRSTTRALLLEALMASEQDVYRGSGSSESMEYLLDEGLITEEVLKSLYAVNSLLQRPIVDGSPIPQTEWQEHIRLTRPWVQMIMERALVFAATIDAPSTELYMAAGSMSAAVRAAVLNRLPQINRSIPGHVALWRLVANPALSAVELAEVWEQMERDVRRNHLLGCVAVQHPAFESAAVDEGSPLLQVPDVRFSRNFSRQLTVR